MARPTKTNALVNTALRRAMIPEDQVTFSPQDVRDIMNEEFGIHVLPVILRAHEEYYVVSDDIPATENKTRYKIPYRAIGNKLREVSYVDTGGAIYEMTRVSIEDAPFYKGQYSTNRIYAYYIENDSIVLMNQTAQSGSIRMSYYLRPNDLVEDNRGGVITNVDTATVPGQTTITMESFPDHFSSTAIFDLIQGRSPNIILTFDRQVVSVDSTAKTVTFTTISDIDSELIVGDVVMKAEESIYAQMPTELQPILSQRVAVKMLEALGDTEGMKNAQTELERMEYNSMSLIDNRSEGSPQKINNTHSTLRETTLGYSRTRRNR